MTGFIHGFDEIVVNWINLTLQEWIDCFRHQILTEIKALWKHCQDLTPEFDENELEYRIGDFLHEYHRVEQDTAESVIDRLQGTFRQPDVLGFLFIMGLSIAFEPVDYVLTAVDVIQALSKGDKKSAGLHLLFGAAPLLKSGMVRGMKHLGRTPLGRLFPARAGMRSVEQLRKQGFSSAQIEALVEGRIVVPGSQKARHKKLDRIDSRPEDRQYNVDWYKDDDVPNKISGNAENMIGLQFGELGYGVVIKPTRKQLDEIGYWSQQTRPDLIIEGKAFDTIAVRTPNARNIADRISEKLGVRQADSLILDITESNVTLQALATQFAVWGDGMLYNLRGGLDLEQLWIRNNDQLFPFLVVENLEIIMLWP